MRPAHFNRVLVAAKGEPAETLINEVVLRAQSQAEYTHENYGHFGLNLRRYAHFTSPIRRYADLIVHRALIRALEFRSGRAGGGRRRARSPTSPSASPAPSGAPWRPSARPRTG